MAPLGGMWMPHFSLFGTSVNIAARMESLSRIGCIQITNAAAKIVMQCPSPLGTPDPYS